MGEAAIEIEFLRLSDLPDLVIECATFHAMLTADSTPEGLAKRVAAFQRLALDGEEEDAIVAVKANAESSGAILGMAALVKSELDAFEDLGPWLAGLIIRPDLEETGLRDQLCGEVESLADELGYTHLCVQTNDTTAFKAQGFEEVEPFERSGTSYWVLGKTL